ncbi:MarR family winged helix-turn-helix transcriptional regulator [Amycolatopsis sp.]|uniref:MarR family winged helix-turn-helix transcriptional regulator n=1 Tax=Amycolatopsis sp. TaxID=37632 RepID=UPI002C1CC991|nr:MarR family transcriptional regulator [Amycolatopsis sp.]HVV14507.1 MarR family transcriptional regulator [Amycolatopsis sp.]
MAEPDASGDGTVEEAGYLLDAVTRLQRAVERIGNLRLRPWEMTMSSYVALRILANRPDLTLGQLSRRCYVRPQTMTRIVAQLEKRGFVERSPHPHNNSAISLAVTGLGRRVLREMSDEVDKVTTTVTSALGPGEVAKFNATLRDCAVRIETEATELSKKD